MQIAAQIAADALAKLRFSSRMPLKYAYTTTLYYSMLAYDLKNISKKIWSVSEKCVLLHPISREQAPVAKRTLRLKIFLLSSVG